MADDFPSSKVFYTEGNQKTKPSHLQLQNDGSSTRNCPSQSYFGVELSEDMNWDPHISKVTSKAKKTLGFLRRT
jgi:hypothetical protein